MPLTKALAQLRSELLVRAGMNTSGTSVDLTPTVLNSIINDAVYEAWDVIVSKWQDQFTTSASVSVVAGTSSYAVTDLFYKHRLLEHADQQKLKPIALDDRHRFYGQSGEPTHYLLMNRLIYLFPTPAANETLTHWHIPIKAEMTADGDTLTLDVPVELKYILATAWRDVLDRQNLDPSPAIAKMQAYEAKLRTASGSMDAAEPFYLGDFSRTRDEELPD